MNRLLARSLVHTLYKPRLMSTSAKLKKSNIKIVGVDRVLTDLKKVVDREHDKKVAKEERIAAKLAATKDNLTSMVPPMEAKIEGSKLTPRQKEKTKQLLAILHFFNERLPSTSSETETTFSKYYSQVQEIQIGENVVDFSNYGFLDPRIVNPQELRNRVLSVQILLMLGVPAYKMSYNMVRRMNVWSQMFPEITTGKIGSLLVQSNVQTNRLRRIVHEKAHVENLIKKYSDEKNDKKLQQLKAIHEDCLKQVNQLAAVIRNSSLSPTDQSTESDRLEHIFNKLGLNNVDKSRAKNILKDHPFMSRLKPRPQSMSLDILKFLQESGCTRDQVINGVYVVNYDYKLIKKTFLEVSHSDSYPEWQKNPSLVPLLAYTIDQSIGVTSSNDLFGAGIFMEAIDQVQ